MHPQGHPYAALSLEPRPPYLLPNVPSSSNVGAPEGPAGEARLDLMGRSYRKPGGQKQGPMRAWGWVGGLQSPGVRLLVWGTRWEPLSVLVRGLTASRHFPGSLPHQDHSLCKQQRARGASGTSHTTLTCACTRTRARTRTRVHAFQTESTSNVNHRFV